MSVPPAAHTHRPDIDGLRAISVGVVVAFHAFFAKGFGGFIGVDVFFVISGYLITGIILRDLAAGRFSFAGFYARRVRRIYPALVLVLAVTLAAGWVQLFDDGFAQLGRHLAAAALFVSNLALYGEAGYFDNASEAKPLLHLWSLGVEEQFYILWPLALALAWRLWRGRGVWALVLLGLGASFAQELWLMGRDQSAAFYIPTARFWEMLAGAALAQAERSGLPKPRWLAEALGAGGLLALLGGLVFITEGVAFPGVAALVPVGAAVAMIAAGPQAFVNARLLGLTPMRWLGGISYPLYLWHWPVLVLVRLSGFSGAQAMAWAVLAAVLLAWVTTRFVEPPLRYGGQAKAKLAGLLVAMGLIGLLGWAAAQGGIRSSTSAQTAPITRQLGWDLAVSSPEQGAACNRLMPQRSALVPNMQGNDFCALQRNGPPDVALIGDSMNLSLFPALSRYPDLNVLLASASEAAPFYDTISTERFDQTRRNNWKLTNQALDYAIASPSIRVVVLSYANGDRLLIDGTVHELLDRADATKAAPKAVLERVMRRTLERLLKAGKRVIVVAPNQRMGFDPSDCLTGLRPIHAASVRQFCGERAGSGWQQIRLRYDAWLRGVLADYPAVQLVDLAQPLCVARGCYAMRDGVMLYRDNLHLSPEGSTVVAPAVHAAILKAKAR
jgi:peptidoglycan/LPS O-acetylase OafA/YrhL